MLLLLLLQGCMNNFTFGDSAMGYYETIAGGAGAGPTWHGRDGVHTHMTNTRITGEAARCACTPASTTNWKKCTRPAAVDADLTMCRGIARPGWVVGLGCVQASVHMLMCLFLFHALQLTRHLLQQAFFTEQATQWTCTAATMFISGVNLLV
jgi:hypothetical protein